MTLVEFLAPLKNKDHKDRILAVLYFKQHYKKFESLTVDNIKRGLKDARVKGYSKVNVADVLAARCGHFVDSPGTKGKKRLWHLTSSGEKYIRDLLGLPAYEPEIEHDVGTLSSLINNIKDDSIRNYIEETILCLQIGALRASIVFLWSGTIRTIQQKMMNYGGNKVSAAIQKYDPKTKKVSRIDHFAYIKDKDTLLAAQELGLFDKNERSTLEDALTLRNKCGHPSKYVPGVKKVSSFIEDIISIVFI